MHPKHTAIHVEYGLEVVGRQGELRGTKHAGQKGIARVQV